MIKSKDYFEKLGFNNLTEVQSKLKNSDINRNKLILSSTGSGKTEGSHYWILNNDKKTIFIQPMRTLATAICNRLNKYHNNFDLKKWTIQHSSIESDKWLKNKYCVTTIDQVLAGYLGFGKQSFIKGKNVLLSNLIFDEVQLFQPDKTLQTTINMLKDINKLGGKFIIMTATMPEYLIDYLSKEFDMDVVICENESVSDRSVKIKYLNTLDYKKINNEDKKQIIICNTQKEQGKIHNEIQDKSRCIILNNYLLQNDREKIEDKVYKYFGKSSKENNKILITTQIVEAGIDISTSIMYTANCPIDNLIQRAGRCGRWGGDGIVYVFKTKNYVYDDEIVDKTNEKIKENSGDAFTWSKQKELVDDILNPFYEKYINDKQIKKNKRTLKKGNKKDLIRDIQNVNLIVSKSKDIKHIQKQQSISIHIDKLKKLKNNDFYIVDKKRIKKVVYNQVKIGDTVIIEGKDCVYDEIGFRIKEGEKCPPFKQYEIDANHFNFDDYINEPWLIHSKLTKNIVKQNIKSNNIFKYNENEINYISYILGLHDIGKLDTLWQSPQ